MEALQKKSLDWDCEAGDDTFFVWLPEMAVKDIKLVVEL